MRVRIEPAPFEIEFRWDARSTPSAQVSDEPIDALRIVDGPDADTLVRIEALGTSVELLMSSFETGLADVTVMFVEETDRLFIGAKRTSFVVDLRRSAVEHRFEHNLFWGFDRSTRPGWILETGELDCLFRALDGRVMARTSVDPPWDCVVEPTGVRFESMVCGRTFLPYPT